MTKSPLTKREHIAAEILSTLIKEYGADYGLNAERTHSMKAVKMADELLKQLKK